MEAAKNELRYYISSPAIAKCFNERGFKLNEDEAGVIAKRFQLLAERMDKKGFNWDRILTTVTNLKNGLFDYFLIKKVKKTYKNLNEVMDKTSSMRVYEITKQEAEKVWKIEKKEIEEMMKSLENLTLEN